MKKKEKNGKKNGLYKSGTFLPRPTPDLPPTYPSKQKLKALAVKIITVISTWNWADQRLHLRSLPLLRSALSLSTVPVLYVRYCTYLIVRYLL